MREQSTSAPGLAPVIPDVLEEHFEELDFLWEQRESVIFAPDWNLDDLAEHEERCEAHLDGLRIAGAHGVELARPALRGDERGAATAAAMILLAAGEPGLEEEVLEVLAEAEAPAREGVRIALRHGDVENLRSRLERLARSGSPDARVAALDVLAFHRFPPAPGLQELLLALEGPARARLFPALARFRGPWSLEDLDRALSGDEPAVARAALETSAWVGLTGLVDRCRSAASGTGPAAAEALAFLGVVGDVDDLRLLRDTLSDPALASAALRGMGALGTVEAIPALLEAMADPALSVEAGAAFACITGAEGIEADEPVPPPDGLSEDERDLLEPVVPPDPDKAAAWWNEARSGFEASGLWQAGLDLAEDTLGPRFDLLPLSCRRDVYLGYRFGDPDDTPDLELEARAVIQRRRNAE